MSNCRSTWTSRIGSRERDSAARIAQALPTLFGVGERKREIGRYALLAHAGLNVLVLLVERSPNRVSHELRDKPLAVFAAASLGIEVADHVHRGCRARIDDAELQGVAHSTHSDEITLHRSHRDRIMRE